MSSVIAALKSTGFTMFQASFSASMSMMEKSIICFTNFYHLDFGGMQDSEGALRVPS
jgi:hypothetical protein